MEFSQIKEIILEGEDLQELYQAHVALEERIGSLYKAVRDEEDRDAKNELKSELSLATSLRSIVHNRQKACANRNQQFNYNFRMAAKIVLEHETYKVINELARLPRKEVKAMKPELVRTRLER